MTIDRRTDGSLAPDARRTTREPPTSSPHCPRAVKPSPSPAPANAVAARAPRWYAHLGSRLDVRPGPEGHVMAVSDLLRRFFGRASTADEAFPPYRLLQRD